VGVATCGREVRLDMYSKGMDQSMLDVAVATKLPVTLSPKFWAEHLGMPYHQADIREQEQPKPGQTASALMKFSAGSCSLLSCGYGDLLGEDRTWKVVHRIWPGTQRLLLWGDPVFAAAYSKAGAALALLETVVLVRMPACGHVGIGKSASGAARSIAQC
jgi:hypothetical protein